MMLPKVSQLTFEAKFYFRNVPFKVPVRASRYMYLPYRQQ